MSGKEGKEHRRPRSTRALIISARDGDRQALGRLLERFNPLLRKDVRSFLEPEVRSQEEEELLQNIHLRIIRSFAKFTGTTRGALASWIRKVARSEYLDSVKHGKRSRRNPGKPLESISRTGAREVPDPRTRHTRELLRREDRELLLRAIRRLSEPQRRLMEYVLQADPSPEDVTRFLGKKPDTARKFVSRTLVRLRQLIAELEGRDADGGPVT